MKCFSVENRANKNPDEVGTQASPESAPPGPHHGGAGASFINCSDNRFELFGKLPTQKEGKDFYG